MVDVPQQLARNGIESLFQRRAELDETREESGKYATFHSARTAWQKATLPAMVLT